MKLNLLEQKNINQNTHLFTWNMLKKNIMLNDVLTLYNHLVAGYEDLLPVAGLGVLQDGGAGLGGSSVGHGQCLQALHSICAVVGQLDGPTLGNGNCRTLSCVRFILKWASVTFSKSIASDMEIAEWGAMARKQKSKLLNILPKQVHYQWQLIYD